MGRMEIYVSDRLGKSVCVCFLISEVVIIKKREIPQSTHVALLLVNDYLLIPLRESCSPKLNILKRFYKWKMLYSTKNFKPLNNNRATMTGERRDFFFLQKLVKIKK